MNPDEYTRRAIGAVLAAAREEPDFGGWLASVLCCAAARLGSSDADLAIMKRRTCDVSLTDAASAVRCHIANALTARRPGSWEAACVQQLLGGTAGFHDEWLDVYEEAP